tara:strand:+ start:541 stop:1065 length:525 start_codon:yes stop_codon:yes gene_type:complete
MESNFLFGEKGKITVFQKGMEVGLKKEPSLRMLFIILIISIYIAHKFEKNNIQQFILILVILLVFITEIINTSIEAIVDRIGLEYNPLSGYAKDLGSSATVCWGIFAIYIWFKWFLKQWSLYESNNTLTIFSNKINTIIIIILIIIITYPLLIYLSKLYKNYRKKHFKNTLKNK